MGHKADHNNIFASEPSKSEVYQKFQQDLRRDSRQFRFWSAIGTIIFVVAGTKGVADGWPWFLFGLCLLAQALVIFIEMSNRNFMMHVLDWMEQEPGRTYADIHRSPQRG
jgi:fatty acid desaturase